MSVLTFLMFFALPRDPVTAHVPEELQRRTARAGPHASWASTTRRPSSTLDYMKGIFVGRDLGSAQGGHCDAPCLGYSYVNSEPVTDTFARVLPVTLSIVIPAAVLWLALGIGLGHGLGAAPGHPCSTGSRSASR